MPTYTFTDATGREILARVTARTIFVSAPAGTSHQRMAAIARAASGGYPVHQYAYGPPEGVPFSTLERRSYFRVQQTREA